MYTWNLNIIYFDTQLYFSLSARTVVDVFTVLSCPAGEPSPVPFFFFYYHYY